MYPFHIKIAEGAGLDEHAHYDRINLIERCWRILGTHRMVQAPPSGYARHLLMPVVPGHKRRRRKAIESEGRIGKGAVFSKSMHADVLAWLDTGRNFDVIKLDTGYRGRYTLITEDHLLRLLTFGSYVSDDTIITYLETVMVPLFYRETGLVADVATGIALEMETTVVERNGIEYLRNARISKDTQILLLPINMNKNHWILIVVDFRNNSMVLFDPLGLYQSRQGFNIHKEWDRIGSNAKLVSSWYSKLLGYNNPVSSWKLWYAEEGCPFQKDGVSCGIIMTIIAMNLHHWITKLKMLPQEKTDVSVLRLPKFDREEIQRWRNTIARELLSIPYARVHPSLMAKLAIDPSIV